MSRIHPDLRSFFFNAANWQYNRCLAPGLSCNHTAIRAHSIQNATVLDMLCRDGHVKAITKRIDKEHGPQLAFEDLGRNQATTFTGFCSEHDSAIFRSIDTNPLDVTSSEHLFLLAYRAIARELHATLDGASKIQSAYLKRVEVGLDNGDEPSAAGMVAVQHMVKAFETYRYKVPFDIALHEKRYDAVRHRTVRLTVDRPTIAVSALFALDNVFHEDTWVNVALSVLPVTPSETVAVFSYLPDHESQILVALQRLFASQGDYQKYELSKLILNYCENFVVSPSHFDKWSEAKVRAITDYFVATLFKGDLDIENEHFYLF